MTPMEVMAKLIMQGDGEAARVVAELIADREAFAEGVRLTVASNVAIKKLADEQRETILALMRRVGE